MHTPYYLKIGKASDLRDKKERMIYRFLEIAPGALSWLTLIAAVFLSWLEPIWVSFFIIAFVAYWLVRTIYFSFHLRASYQHLKENEKTDWLGKINGLPRFKHIYHLVVLPTHRESQEIIFDTLYSLEKSDYPKEKMIIVLTCEEGGNKMAVVEAEKYFSDKFFKFFITFHPQGLPDEIVGKGSNESWGVRQVKDLIIDPLKIPYENIIVSSFDVDTCVFPKYFSCLSHYYLTQKDPTHCSFQPIPLFTNNIWQAPPISRIFAFSATFWQMMCQERPEKLITFSSHSMSFKALVDVDFRQTNIVSDDSRIFWQCYFVYNGDYKVVPMYYPVSMDANAASSFLRTMKNVYKQQRRWAYGVADIPYVIFGFFKNSKIPFAKKLSLGFTIFEGHWSWAVGSFLTLMLGWLPLMLGSREFNQTLLAYNLPNLISRILTVGMLGLISSVYFSILLLPPRPIGLGKRRYLFFMLEWALLPFIMIFFTSLPALEAQTRLMLGKYMGFWLTEKFRKK